MAILRSHGVLLVDAIPTHTPTAAQARLARLEDTLTFYYYNGSGWITLDLDAIAASAGVVSVSGTNVDNTDPNNPIINLQTALQTAVTDAGGNYTATEVEGILAEIATSIQTISTDLATLNVGSIDSIDLAPTANANEFTVSITWIDSDGNPQTTNDVTPVTITGLTNLVYIASATQGIVTSSTGLDAILPAANSTDAGLLLPADKDKLDLVAVTQAVDLDAVEAASQTAVQGVTDTDSIDLTKDGSNNISADLKVSATQSGASVSVLADGLSISVDAEVEPSAFDSAAAALIALGAGAKFQYSAANLDGAVEGTVAWT